jgi:5-(carboxyamino)imidazole ribonucleotide synthase
VIDSLDDAADLFASGTPLLAEERVAIGRELAADVARTPSGELAGWPVVETVQNDGICVEVIAPAPALTVERADEAQELAKRIATELGVTGVLAVELFDTTDGRLLVNELAMRPHNSAHWTIEGARTSQFEQHLRAVLDLPLGVTDTTAPVAVMANVLAGPTNVVPHSLGERLRRVMDLWPTVKIHIYGKSWRPGRKVGHVTALGSDLDEVRRSAVAAADALAHGEGASSWEGEAS